MNIRRVAKMSGALFAGQGINLSTQLMLPPLFLHAYGVAAFGEWITLTAAVSYLGTLNFGLQTFANNQVGISVNRGELEEVKTLQATAFALLLTIVSAGAVITLVVLLLPISTWLQLSLNSRTSSIILYLFGLQMLTKMISGFLAGTFLAAGVSYRGTNWNNAQSLCSLAGSALLAFCRASFVLIAVFQLGTAILFVLLIALDLRTKARSVFPKLSYVRLSSVKGVLRPSGYFAMLFSSNFLVYQLPVLVMQRFIGPEKVVVFSLTRTIYSMSRQALTAMTWAIGPEIVELHGRRDWPLLLRLYDRSERIIFALVPVVNVGTFLATPILFTIWLHRPQLYDIRACIYFTMISAVMGIKEHKYQFQISSNEHSEMARFLFGTYLALLALSLPAIRVYGILGFLAVWLMTEVIQLGFILYLNRRFFHQVARIDFVPVYKVGLLMLAAMVVCTYATSLNSGKSMIEEALFTLTAVVVLSSFTYSLFEINELRNSLFAQITRRA